MIIGKLIKIFRKMNDVSLRDLGKELKISAATLNRIENGHPMDQETILKIMNWLFGEKPSALECTYRKVHCSDKHCDPEKCGRYER